MSLSEGFDVGCVLGDQRFRASLDRKALEVELVDGAAEAVGIVEDYYATTDCLSAEQDSSFHGPRRLGVDRRIISKHENVDLSYVNAFDLDGLRVLQSREELGPILVLVLWKEAAVHGQGIVCVKHEVGWRDVAHAMPPAGSRVGED